MHVFQSEFFWGVVVGVVLTGLGGIFQAFIQSKWAVDERLKLIRSFAADTLRNIQKITGDMENTRRQVGALHSDFLALLDVEISVFGRNREQLVSLPIEIRDNVRAFVTDCAIYRAQIGGGLENFNRMINLANDLQAAGNGPQAQRTRDDANVPLQEANKALDRLLLRCKDAPQYISELQK